MSKHHNFKTFPDQFDAMAAGKKLFELRVNDRNYEEGDTFTSFRQEKAERSSNLSGHKIEGTITYVLLTGFGLAENLCIFGVNITGYQNSNLGSYDPDEYMNKGF